MLCAQPVIIVKRGKADKLKAGLQISWEFVSWGLLLFFCMTSRYVSQLHFCLRKDSCNSWSGASTMISHCHVMDCGLGIILLQNVYVLDTICLMELCILGKQTWRQFFWSNTRSKNVRLLRRLDRALKRRSLADLYPGWLSALVSVGLVQRSMSSLKTCKNGVMPLDSLLAVWMLCKIMVFFLCLTFYIGILQPRIGWYLKCVKFSPCPPNPKNKYSKTLKMKFTKCHRLGKSCCLSPIRVIHEANWKGHLRHFWMEVPISVCLLTWLLLHFLFPGLESELGE